MLDRLAAIKSDEDSILGHPDVVRAKKIIGQPESAWSYVDTRYGIETFYPIGLILLQMGTSMAQGQGIDVDVTAIPSLRTLTAHTFGEVRSTRQVEGGSLAMAFGPWPMASSPGFSLNAASIGMGASILMPALSRARELSKRTVCSANLRGIGQALYISAMDTQRFPDSISTVIKENNATSRQFICPSTAVELGQSPSDEELASCFIYISGQTINDPPNSVLLYERPENHQYEGANVLFLDGHVTFITDLDELNKMVEETKSRIAAKK
ncbi:MAG: hypothetical protein IPK83_08305 [Planctomycetes bacterium]|nr:hypothetical protein [Planctomycetota bacterium]